MLPRLTRPASRRDLFGIYLADHDAAAAAAVSLARRAADSTRHPDTREVLVGLAVDLDHDREQARRLMPAVGAEPKRWKALAGHLLERVGRLKLNGRVRGYSRLSQVWELEGLLDALAASRRLWQAADDIPGLGTAAGVDPADMLARIDERVARIEPLWRSATGMAFPGIRQDIDGVVDGAADPPRTRPSVTEEDVA